MSLPNLTEFRNAIIVSASAMALAGCASLPSSGPTARQIVRSASPDENKLGFQIVDIDGPVLASLSGSETSAHPLSQLAAAGANDQIGPGDILAVSIYEVGVSLFGGGASRVAGDGFDPSAHGEDFAAIVVDRSGAIRLPYVGRLIVSGHTPGEVERMIEAGLRGKSQSPQALVAVKSNISNIVYVSGDVRRPGKVELTLGRERLLDAIANAGGPAASAGGTVTGGTVSAADDMIVRFTRRSRTIEQRLSSIRSGAPDDLFMLPGDHIELITQRRTFTVFGATSKVSQIAFEAESISLAEAVARVGGPSDQQADPTAVFLFRFVPATNPNGVVETPVIYRLNMMNPASYFISQRFAMRDKDLIYIANARANQPTKFVSIINQLFSPFITARQFAR